MNPESDLAKLMANFPQAGAVEWIGTRPARHAALFPVKQVEAVAAHGLTGDHYATRTNGKRQVTLIQAEHLVVVARLLGLERVAPALVRRNIVISGINLFALRTRRFSIGKVLLEGAGICEPCSRMEEVLGPGGYNAMRGHGGVVCRVLEGGRIKLGAALSPVVP